MIFPPEVLERIYAYEKEHSIDRNHLIPLAMKSTRDRTEEVVELMNQLLKDPDSFEWPDDPLLCVALAFMRSSASWITRKINEEYGVDGEDDEDDDQADWWKADETE